MKKLKIVFFLFFLTHVLSAQYSAVQNKQIDSLNLVINNPASHDTSRAASYVALSDIIYIINLDTLIPVCDKARHIAENNIKYNKLSAAEVVSYKRTLGNAYNNLGVAYINRGEADKALVNHLKGLEYRKALNNKKDIGQSLSNIGQVYDNLGQVEKALDHYEKGLKIAEEINDKSGVALGMNNIGYVYFNLGESDKALDYYFKALKLNRELGDKYSAAFALSSIGGVYYRKDDQKKALEYYKQSLEIHKEIGNKLGLANSLNSIGMMYGEKQDYDKALDYCFQSLKLREEIKSKSGMAGSYYNIAYTYFNKKDINNAFIYANKSMDVSRELKYPQNIRDAAQLLKKLHTEKGQYKEALKMFELYMIMRDSIRNEELHKVTLKQYMKYEFEKQQAVRELEYKNETEKREITRKEENARKNIVILFVALAFVIVIIFSFFLLKRFRLTQKQKIVIEKQKLTVEEKQKEILDSIYYAKRIQDSLLATERYIEKAINRLKKQSQ